MIYEICSSDDIEYKGYIFQKDKEKLYKYERENDFILYLYEFDVGNEEIPDIIDLSVVNHLKINNRNFFFWGLDLKKNKKFTIFV